MNISLRTFALLLCPFVCSKIRAQTTNFVISSSADAFLWAQEANSNFGAAGALAVAGPDAENFAADKNGAFDSLMRFPTAAAKGLLDASLGTNSWTVSALELEVTEDGAPVRPIFNYGVGAIEIRGIAADTWLEGTGKPDHLTTDGVTFRDLPSLINPQLDVSLGYYTNSGSTRPLTFPLPLAGILVSNFMAGAPLNFHLRAVSPTVGFTFHSRNYIDATARPALRIKAMATNAPFIPAIQSINLVDSNQVAIYFRVRSNVTCQLEAATRIPASNPGDWTEVFIANPAFTNRDIRVLDSATNHQIFYRLRVPR